VPLMTWRICAMLWLGPPASQNQLQRHTRRRECADRCMRHSGSCRPSGTVRLIVPSRPLLFGSDGTSRTAVAQPVTSAVHRRFVISTAGEVTLGRPWKKPRGKYVPLL